MWLLDLGNTRLKIARARPSGCGPVLALAHDEADFDAQLKRTLHSDEYADDGNDDDVPTAWLASVASTAVTARVEAALDAIGLRIERARCYAECDGLRIAYADPQRLGVDRFLGLLAARARGGDWLLASFGSALTIDLLDAQGQHRGGLIGMASAQQIDALRERFPALDRGAGDGNRSWATDTPDAVAAGARLQAQGLVLAAYFNAREELGCAPRLLLAGGDAAAQAPELARHLGVAVEVCDALVIEGLGRYAKVARG